MHRSILLLLTFATCLAAPAAASAATPFTAGLGTDPAVAVAPDGSGHVVWGTEEASDKVGYCRASAGAGACNRIALLSFAGMPEAHLAGRPVVFAPAPNRVVVVAACWNCGDGTNELTYQWISNDGGTSFSLPVAGGSEMETEGFGTWLDEISLFVGVTGSRAKASQIGGGEGIQYAPGPLFVYGPEIVRVPGTTKLVAATNNLEVVKYGMYESLAPPTALTINNPVNWTIDRTLSGAEADNSETALNSGPNGVFLTYLNFVANDSRVGLRQFDPATVSFGAPTYVEGPDPIDNNSLDMPDSFQDPAGRIHVVWRSLHDDNRLRYTVSGTSGGGFSAAANLASREFFNEPEVAAGADGRGFAVWTDGTTGPIRVVPLDPQAEPPKPTPPKPAPKPAAKDTAKPKVSGFGIDNRTLRPGEKARFSFNANEAGQAVLTVEQRFAGLKGKKKGKKVCLPKTKKRLAALRRRADDPKALAKLLKRSRCTGYKRIGEIRQAARAGRNEIVFGGRIAGRKLKPGAYRALLVVTDSAGLVSRTETVNFKVVGKKPKKKRGAR